MKNDEEKINKKIQYSIRMLSWHTKLATRYADYIKKWLNKNNLNCEKEVQKVMKTFSDSEDNNQTTIYDFIDGSETSNESRKI